MKSKKYLLALSLVIFGLAGCSKYYYNPAPQVLPQYITKLAIRPFANHTSQFRIEDKLTLAVQNLISQDGRYAITSEEQADGVLIGDITKYILEPLMYDANNTLSNTNCGFWLMYRFTTKSKIKRFGPNPIWAIPSPITPLRQGNPAL